MQSAGRRNTHLARNAVARLCLSALALAPFLLHGSGWLSWGLLTQAEHFFYDARLRLTLPDTVDPRIVIVDIDERSLAAEGQWPWPRDTLARLVDQLFETYGIRLLGLDVVFAEPDQGTALLEGLIRELDTQPSPESRRLREQVARHKPDLALAQALAGRPVVLGYVFKNALQPGEAAGIGQLPPPVPTLGALDLRPLLQPLGYAANLPAFQQAAAGGGFFDSAVIDSDGVIRRMPLLQHYRGQTYESLALALARRAHTDEPAPLQFTPAGRGFLHMQLGAQPLRIPEDAVMHVPYRGYQGVFRYVSATDVLRGDAPAELLFDTLVLLGATAPGVMDLRSTPVGHAYAGVEVHANLVSGLLDHRFRYVPARVGQVEAALLVVIGLLLALLLPLLTPAWGAALLVALLLGGLLLNLCLWVLAQQVLPMASPLFYTLGAALLQMSYSFLVESRHKRRLSRLFGQYVPPEIVEEMDQSGEEVTLAGTSREMTVLFADVRGFTRIAEGLEPAVLTQIMNAFLTPITRVIHQHRGTVDKYMGDAVMAFWGAPMNDAAHARHALEAALDMVRTLRALRLQFEARGWPPIEIGIGLSTGMMHVGNMGSAFRVAYTVLGDTVNLGARLEALTRQYEVDIIVSEATALQVPDFAFRELDRVRVKGKTRPVTLFEPVGPRAALVPAQAAALDAHAHALACYHAQDWAAAQAAFTALAARSPHPLYAQYLWRLDQLQRGPARLGPDGVFNPLAN